MYIWLFYCSGLNRRILQCSICLFPVSGKHGNKASVLISSEVKKFSLRYENNYDITTDERYNAWLEMYHPSEVESQHPKAIQPSRCEL